MRLSVRDVHALAAEMRVVADGLDEMVETFKDPMTTLDYPPSSMTARAYRLLMEER